MRAFWAALLLALSFGANAGPLDRDFQKLEKQLHLTLPQKQQFDVAVGATQRALVAVAMAGMQIQERVKAEFAKPRPDLNILYDIHEQMIEQQKPLFREARDEWSKFFALLDDEQLRIAKRYIEDRLDLFLR